ncbi:hypothetical protein KM176_23850 [Pseudooceanicola sp. CBS1P-1]|uniref:Uncharacterized protein n=1 Tax=Pseudooceanicola albus TaxID=2692189 RepID=A0A6L7GAR4_9RHOB|nr:MULTISPECIES: hypothetical protein [Pseudooceanicola]MBT9386897.1 hypothetical protein [Pseudooceanicola endophyticus]MXN21049.1 hypothetical protein [Pseudooceanicola albus]
MHDMDQLRDEVCEPPVGVLKRIALLKYRQHVGALALGDRRQVAGRDAGHGRSVLHRLAPRNDLEGHDTTLAAARTFANREALLMGQWDAGDLKQHGRNVDVGGGHHLDNIAE